MQYFKQVHVCTGVAQHQHAFQVVLIKMSLKDKKFFFILFEENLVLKFMRRFGLVEVRFDHFWFGSDEFGLVKVGLI